jgi:RNA 2',3'-cyclic 3'-phosphodiesterase
VSLFVAVYPPPAAIADLDACVRGLAIGAPRGPGQSVRLVPPDRWHITLAFLGDLSDRQTRSARIALANAAQRWVVGVTADRDGGNRRHPPRIRLGGGGRFGGGRSSPLFTGARGEVEVLGELAADVRRELRASKVPFDGKAFRPHITLARPGDRLSEADLDADLAALQGYEGPTWPVEAIELVHSNKGPKITYDRLAAFALTS